MANAHKYSRADMNKLVAHDERTENDHVKNRRNETIDPTRTHLNYAFESVRERDLDIVFENYEEDLSYLDGIDDLDDLLNTTPEPEEYGFWDTSYIPYSEKDKAPEPAEQEQEPASGHKYERLTPLGYIKEFGNLPNVSMHKRHDLKMGSWVVTMPANVTENEQERFFEETYRFLRERYCDKVEKAVGMSNCISAVVHLDETTPHMHFKFIPTYYNKKYDKWHVSAKEVLNKRDLDTFHQDLSRHMSRVFGRDIGIVNEATRDGNKSVVELKKQTAREVKILEEHLNALRTNENALRSDLADTYEQLHVAEEKLSQSVTERLRAYQRVVARLPKHIREQIERAVDQELHPRRYRARSHDFDER